MNTKAEIIERMETLATDIEEMESPYKVGDFVSFNDGEFDLIACIESMDDECITARVQAIHANEFEATDDVRILAMGSFEPYNSSGQDIPAPAISENDFVKFFCPDGEIKARVVSVGEVVVVEPYMAVENGYEPTGVHVNRDVKGLEKIDPLDEYSERKLLLKFKDLTMEYDEENKVGTIDGYASTYGNIDLGGDIVSKGAFTQTLKHKNGRVPLLLDHGYTTKDIAGVAFLEDSDGGLKLSGEMPLEVRDVKEAYIKIKFLNDRGVKMGLSIGYDNIKSTMSADGIRTLRELALHEVSITPFPMNTEAMILATKSRRMGYHAKRDVWQTIIDAPIGNQEHEGATALLEELKSIIQTIKP